MATKQITKAVETVTKAAPAVKAAPVAKAAKAPVERKVATPRKAAAKPAAKVDPMAQMLAQADVANAIKAADAAADAALKAEVKAKRTTRPAPKKDAAATTQNSVVVKVAHALNFYIAPGGRGGMVKEYTAAIFKATGMDQGKPFPKKDLMRIWGGVNAHHINAGNLVVSEDGVSLTARGMAHFSARKVETSAIDALMEIFKSGTPDGKMIKNSYHVLPYAK